MGADTNTVVIAGRLTRDPELRAVGSTSVASLRLASNSSKKVGDNWEDVAGFFNVSVWGSQGENVARFCSKGSQVVVTGRLVWREWEKDGVKRQEVGVTASQVQFVGGKSDRPAAVAEVPIESEFDEVPF